MEDIKRLNSAGIKAKLSGELTAEDFDSIKMTNAEEKAAIESQLTALESEKTIMEELIEQSQRELLDVVST